MNPYACSPRTRSWHRVPARGYTHYGYSPFRQEAFSGLPVSNRPFANLTNTVDAYHIQLAVPGLERDQIKIEMIDDRLKISATAPEAQSGLKYKRKEFDYTGFTRSFRMPGNADANGIQAKLEAGILNVYIPKVKPVSQEIKIF